MKNINVLKLALASAYLMIAAVPAYAAEKKSDRGVASHTVHKDHAHKHDDKCGHKAVKHDGHTDYEHDGHMHASHEGHVDDHGKVTK